AGLLGGLATRRENLPDAFARRRPARAGVVRFAPPSVGRAWTRKRLRPAIGRAERVRARPAIRLPGVRGSPAKTQKVCEHGDGVPCVTTGKRLGEDAGLVGAAG